MNRVFKFRFWDSKEKKFLYGTSATVGFEGDLYVNSAKETNRGDFVVQQFTGLLDKNGKQIYEGDILKLFNDKDEYYEVVYNCFDNDILGFILEGNGGRGDWFSSKDREVIGNIFENSNLLA